MQLLPLGCPGGLGDLLEQPGLLQPLRRPGGSKGGVTTPALPLPCCWKSLFLLFPQTGLVLDQSLRALGSLDLPPHSLDFTHSGICTWI